MVDSLIYNIFKDNDRELSYSASNLTHKNTSSVSCMQIFDWGISLLDFAATK